MKDLDGTIIMHRYLQMRSEYRAFRQACAEHMQKAKKHTDAVDYLAEESMILKWESIAKRSEVNTLVKITASKAEWDGFGPVRDNYERDRREILKMLREVRHAQISDNNSSLINLRNIFLNLSSLPDPGDCAPEG